MLRKIVVSTLVVCMTLFASAGVFAAEKKAKAIEPGEKSATVHYKYTNFAAELGNTNMQNFGDKVDQAMKETNVHAISALALELNLAEKSSGKTASGLTSAQLLQLAADMAEKQKNKEALNIVASAFNMIGDSSKAENYKKIAMNVKERATYTTFDLCVDNYNNDSYTIIIDGKNVGEVAPYGRKCGENVGFVGTTYLSAVGWNGTVNRAFQADPYGSYTWTIGR